MKPSNLIYATLVVAMATSCDNQVHNVNLSESTQAPNTVNEFIQQGQLIGLTKMKSTSKYTSAPFTDLFIPIELYNLFINGGIRDGSKVSQACATYRRDFQVDNGEVLGIYKLVLNEGPQGQEYKLLEITKDNLDKLQALLKERFLSGESQVQLQQYNKQHATDHKTTWLRKVLNKNWQSVNQEPQLG